MVQFNEMGYNLPQHFHDQLNYGNELTPQFPNMENYGENIKNQTPFYPTQHSGLSTQNILEQNKNTHHLPNAFTNSYTLDGFLELLCTQDNLNINLQKPFDIFNRQNAHLYDAEDHFSDSPQSTTIDSDLSSFSPNRSISSKTSESDFLTSFNPLPPLNQSVQTPFDSNNISALDDLISKNNSPIYPLDLLDHHNFYSNHLSGLNNDLGVHTPLSSQTLNNSPSNSPSLSSPNVSQLDQFVDNNFGERTTHTPYISQYDSPYYVPNSQPFVNNMCIQENLIDNPVKSFPDHTESTSDYNHTSHNGCTHKEIRSPIQLQSTPPPDKDMWPINNKNKKTKKKAKKNSNNDNLPNSLEIAKKLIDLRTSDREFSVNELNFITHACNPVSSVHLQTEFEKLDSTQRINFLDLIQPDIVYLSMDPHGSFLVIKILDCGTDDEKQIISKQLLKSILTLTCHEYGCRVIQKAIETLHLPNQILLSTGIVNNVLKCIEDQNGNHVIQKFIEKMPPHTIHFIICAIEDNFVDIATHCYGCRVVQRIIRFCPSSQIKICYQEIINNLMVLAKHKYANYIVQLALRYGTNSCKDVITKAVCNNLLEFSTQKYACNIVEIALKHSTEQNIKSIINTALIPDKEGKTIVYKTMNHEFGNYVVQRLLQAAKGADREAILNIFNKYNYKLQSAPYGKHIINAINRSNMAVTKQ